MNAPYYVETLTRNGEVRRRERFMRLPVRIGRGYDNDVIVDDAHAGAHHAVLDRDEEGNLVLRSLGEHAIGHRGRHVAQLALDGDTVFRLGHTSLRLRTADYDVAASSKVASSRWDGWTPALVGFGLTVLLALFGVWASDTDDIDASQYFTASAAMLAMLLVWCGLWALANRLFAGRMRFGRHVFVAACGLLVFEMAGLATQTAAYAFSFELLTRYGSHLTIALGFGVIFFHLMTINPQHRRGFSVVCVALVLLGSGLRLVFNDQNNGRFGDEWYMSELIPAMPRLAVTEKSDELFAAAKSLQAKVDAARVEKVRLGAQSDM